MLIEIFLAGVLIGGSSVASKAGASLFGLGITADRIKLRMLERKVRVGLTDVRDSEEMGLYEFHSCDLPEGASHLAGWWVLTDYELTQLSDAMTHIEKGEANGEDWALDFELLRKHSDARLQDPLTRGALGI